MLRDKEDGRKEMRPEGAGGETERGERGRGERGEERGGEIGRAHV